jgi:hypothetical protein
MVEVTWRSELARKTNFLASRSGRYTTKSDRLLRCREMSRRANSDVFALRKNRDYFRGLSHREVGPESRPKGAVEGCEDRAGTGAAGTRST